MANKFFIGQGCCIIARAAREEGQIDARASAQLRDHCRFEWGRVGACRRAQQVAANIRPAVRQRMVTIELMVMMMMMVLAEFVANRQGQQIDRRQVTAIEVDDGVDLVWIASGVRMWRLLLLLL